MSKASMFDGFPSELLHEVFQYLTAYDIINAFHGINRRINRILSTHAKYDLNFQSWPKSKYDLVCQIISPEQVRSLVLSDGDDTVRQIHSFFRLFYIRRFVHLESFTLIDVTELDWNKISAKLHYLTNLSHLSIKSTGNLLPKTVPPCLKHLSIGTCSMNDLHHWLLCTPCLVKLEAQLAAPDALSSSAFRSTPIRTDVQQLKVQLAVKSNITFDEIELLFASMPKLYRLTFVAAGGFRVIRGERWEELIQRYLPQLKDFRFKLHPRLPDTNVQQLLQTFQTPFWLQEHHWRLHCDYHQVPNSNYRDVKDLHLYTLPYSNEQFYLHTSTQASTTTRREEYATIKDLYLTINGPWRRETVERYYFPHLQSLTICILDVLIPISDLIDLSQIKHLTLENSNGIGPEKFYTVILRYSTSLQALTLSWHRLAEITGNFADERICSLLKKQIKYLNVSGMIPDKDTNIPEPIQCLVQTFATNVAKLSLQVTSLDTILVLLNKMLKLQSIKMEYDVTETKMTNDEFLLWLTGNVPRLQHFTYQIRTLDCRRFCLLMWISA